jgi:Na+/melibiose symporter-like transporter
MSGKNATNFFAGYLLSAFGYEFVFFVMTVHIYNLTGSALDMGIFAAVSFVPRLFSPIYGLVADRCDRTKVFTTASALTGVLICLLAFLDKIAWVYACWFVISIFAMVILNVRTTLMVEIMRENNLRGNSAVLVILNSARVVAPFAGGPAAALWTPRSLLFIASLIYLAGAAVMTFVRLRQRPDAGTMKPRGMLADVKDGIVCIINENSLRFLAIAGIFWRLFLGLQVSLFIVYVKSFFGLGSSAYGLFMTCIAVGSIAGSLLGPGIARRVDVSRLVVVGLGAHYLLFAALGLIRDFRTALAIAFTGYLLFYATLVALHSIRDKATESGIRGRVCGSITAILTPPGVASMLLGGYLAGVYGVEKVILGAGLSAFASLAVTWGVFSGLRIRVPERVPQ